MHESELSIDSHHSSIGPLSAYTLLGM